MQKPDPKKIIAAQKAIRARLGTAAGEDDVSLFVSHHIDELNSEEWVACLGSALPSPQDVIDCLVLRDAWDSREDGTIDTYDFTLPKDLTQYVICVRFDGDAISEISMES